MLEPGLLGENQCTCQSSSLYPLSLWANIRLQRQVKHPWNRWLVDLLLIFHYLVQIWNALLYNTLVHWGQCNICCVVNVNDYQEYLLCQASSQSAMASWRLLWIFVWTVVNSRVFFFLWEERNIITKNHGTAVMSLFPPYYGNEITTFRLTACIGTNSHLLSRLQPFLRKHEVQRTSPHALLLQEAFRCFKFQADCVGLPPRHHFILVQRDNNSSLNETPRLDISTAQIARTRADKVEPFCDF